MKDHCEGLICMAGGESGVITKNFLNDDYAKTSKLISLLSETYKKDFFLEIQRDNKNSILYENFLIETSNKKKIPLVATNENYFLEKSYFNTHDALLSISQQKYLDSENRMKSSIDYHFQN